MCKGSTINSMIHESLLLMYLCPLRSLLNVHMLQSDSTTAHYILFHESKTDQVTLDKLEMAAFYLFFKIRCSVLKFTFVEHFKLIVPLRFKARNPPTGQNVAKKQNYCPLVS